MRLLKIFCASWMFLSCLSIQAGLVPEEVAFLNGNYSLRGYLYRPDGDGRFPVIVWNHGHAKHLFGMPAKEYSQMATFFVAHGYAVFMPDRHVKDIGDQEYSPELQALLKSNHASKADIQTKTAFESLEINNGDIIAALNWLKAQPFADPNRIVMSGWSSGAVQSLSLSEKNLGVRAYVLFSTGIFGLSEPLQSRLKSAVKNSKAPIFLIYAENEPSLAARDLLGPEVEKKQKRNRVKTYSFSGDGTKQSPSLASVGSHVWGKDVLDFIDESMKNSSQSTGYP